MKYKNLLSALFMMFSVSIYSGNIILYKYSKNGVPKESTQVWELQYNKKIWVYYKHDYTYNTNTEYRVSISKSVNGVYVRTENKYFPVQKGKNSSIVYLDIKETGNYIISIIDDKGFITSEQNYTVI